MEVIRMRDLTVYYYIFVGTALRVDYVSWKHFKYTFIIGIINLFLNL